MFIIRSLINQSIKWLMFNDKDNYRSCEEYVI